MAHPTLLLSCLGAVFFYPSFWLLLRGAAGNHKLQPPELSGVPLMSGLYSNFSEFLLGSKVCWHDRPPVETHNLSVIRSAQG